MDQPDLQLIRTALSDLAPQGRTALLPALHIAQEIYGYIPEIVSIEISSTLKVPQADISGVIDFYTLFHRKPIGKTLIHVCNDPACAIAGADGFLKRISEKMEENQKSSSKHPAVTIECSACLGLCEHAPAVLVQGIGVPAADNKSWEDLIAGKFNHPHTKLGGNVSLLTRNCGKGVTTWLSQYLAGGGYKALQKALHLSPESVIDEIKSSGLVGRGGAAFPTGIKLESAAKAENNPKYVVCNGDEAEPGTFKDRVLMEDDPHSILEGLIIEAYAIGAHQGYIYIRGEYNYQRKAMLKAIEEAREAGFLGKNILGSKFDFDVEIRQGAGAYICGEETALLESIEGKRGFARSKPPFPTIQGLFGKPTVISNVETLANIPLILNIGSSEYRKLGTEKSPGPKLFCISGDVLRPGLYETALGIPLRELIFNLAGGMRDGGQFQAALIGGAAGMMAAENDLDVNMSFEGLKSAGLTLGAGVITVFDQSRDLMDILLRLAHFFEEESCGKCYPCQLGTQKQSEIMERIAAGLTLPGDMERLADIANTMTDSSLCGLGQTAASAIMSAINNWPELFSPGDFSKL